MTLVWVFILGFIMLGVLSADYNKKQDLMRAQKNKGFSAEYLSVWLTFFVFAFLEPEKHDDPFWDARQDVAKRFPIQNTIPGLVQWYPPADPNESRSPANPRHIMGPGPIFKTIVEQDTIHCSVPRLCYMKMYEELVDLYNAWFEICPVNSDRIKPELARVYQQCYPHYKDKVVFQHLAYRQAPSGLIFSDKAWDASKDIDLLTYNGLHVSNEVREKFPMMQSLLKGYWKKYNINPTAPNPNGYQKEKSLPTYRTH